MKNKIVVVISFLLGGLLFGTIGVYAATTLASSSVSYDNATSGGSSTNVQGAIDELYTKTLSGGAIKYILKDGVWQDGYTLSNGGVDSTTKNQTYTQGTYAGRWYGTCAKGTYYKYVFVTGVDLSDAKYITFKWHNAFSGTNWYHDYQFFSPLFDGNPIYNISSGITVRPYFSRGVNPQNGLATMELTVNVKDLGGSWDYKKANTSVGMSWFSGYADSYAYVFDEIYIVGE